MNAGMDARTAHQITQNNRCARCGGRLIDSYGGAYGYPDSYLVRCARNIDHQGFRRPSNTR